MSRSRTHKRSIAWGCLVPALLTVGCTDNPPTAPVSGTITRNGQAVTSGRVLLLPRGGGKQAIGTIADDGKFTVTTFSSGDGALIGNHHAVVLKATSSNSDDSFSYESSKDADLQVKPDGPNEFTIELESESWQPLRGN